MSLAKDIRFNDDDNDLFIDPQNGDFSITDSDTRHVNDIIESFVGWWKESPTVGVGIKKSLAQSGSIQTVSRKIRIQLLADGYNVTNIGFDSDSKVFVTGNRNNVNL
ncbi:MAG: hypothetical protein GY822_27525 [Deltaproteobacteria bacterium]|nr:hypothetical protein [Deltaproteobacteria bacterium]